MPNYADDILLFQRLGDVVAELAEQAKTDRNRQGLQRLVTTDEAQRAWRKLRKKVGDKFDDSLVINVVGRAVAAYRDDSEKRTYTEINAACLNAAKLAEQLLALIDENAQLQTHDGPVMPILGAYGWTEDYKHDGDELEARLRDFVAFARHSAQIPPAVSHPNSQRADQHVFANSLSLLFNNYHGSRSPLHDIVAGFTSAVFDDATIDADLVKKWWQRLDRRSIFE